MRTGNRPARPGTARLVVAATAVAAVAASACVALLQPAGGRPAQPAARVTPAADPAYRLAYTSSHQPVLRAVATTGPTHPSAPVETGGTSDYEADARAGALVWVSRRAPAGQVERDGDLWLLPSGATTPVRLTDDDAVDRRPELSPNGRLVAFSSDRGGSSDIWVIGADGTGLRQLTAHPGEDTWPTWSPDGTQLAFASTRDGLDGDVYVLAATGGTPRRITDTPGTDGEPAWSPRGDRIAFTSTRRGGAGHVYTVAPTGGPATPAVPGPGDSAEAAWAPDGHRLAFVTHRADPAGDVYLTDGTVVTPLAAGPGEPAEDPTWRGDQVIWTTGTAPTGTAGDTADVWSSAPDGSDQRDLSARAGAGERAPAFSADGRHLAYSADAPGGAARIVVTAPDGGSPVTLAPPGTLPTDRDTDPTWSPDATMIAFTRVSQAPAPDGDPSGAATGPTAAGPAAGSTSRILVVRVADGRLLGQLPVPPALDADDIEPAWSPGGDRIAIVRSARPVSSALSLPRVDRPALPDSSFTVSQEVPTPRIPAQPDIVFLIDRTTSMEPVFAQLQQDVIGLIGDLDKDVTGARFGLSTFTGWNPTTGESDPDMYKPEQVLTDRADLVQDAVAKVKMDDRWSEEDWFYALRSLATDDPGPGFRTDSSRIIVLISDTYSRDKRDQLGEPIDPVALGNTLRDKGIYLVGVPIDDPDEEGLNHDHVAEYLTKQTGGKLTAGSSPGEVTKAIKDGIHALTLTVRPTAQCDAGLSVAFTPDPAQVPAGTPASFTENIAVDVTAVPGARLHCTVQFLIGAAGPDPALRQEIWVDVAYRDRPLVWVDDVTAEAAGPDGNTVKYEAHATDPDGREMPPPSCTPPSGSLFPIGQTVVTCTATGPGGQVGRDTALITVLDPAAKPDDTRIWLVGVRTDSSGTLVFGDQREISHLVGDPCAAGTADRAPAWSPGGDRLAFAGNRRLCVIRPDGSDPHAPLLADTTDPLVADPAWTPDGTRIAVSLDPVDETGWRRIVTVPSGGGPTSPAVGGDGDYGQPTWQPLPVPDLSLSVATDGQPGYVGGDELTVTWTVHNASTRAAEGAWLSVHLPAQTRPETADPRCRPDPQVCLLGDLGVGDTTTVVYRLHPDQAVDTVATGRLTASVAQRPPTTRDAATPIVVRQPTLLLDPPIGPPGFVTQVRGTDFPPGATIRLTWRPGITASPDTVVVAPDGTFGRQQLVMRKDALGPRDLQATLVSGGAAFAPVSARFLVVARALDPPIFDGRR